MFKHIGQRFDVAALPALAFVAILVLIGARSDRFLSPFNVSNVLTQIAPLLLVAAGQTFVIATAGIDLSVGSIVSLTSVISATMFAHAGVPATVVVSILAATSVGVVNGILVNRGLEPFLVTLATLSVVQGIAFTILASPGGTVPDSFGKVAGYFANNLIPYALPLVLVVVVVATVVLRRTRLGFDIRTVGSNVDVAILCGVRVERAQLWAYGLSGFLGGLAGLFVDARTLGGDPLAGSTYTLDAIAAVVLGGTAISGGRASVVGSALGATALGLLSNVLNFAHISNFYQQSVKGVVVVAAVSIPVVLVLAGRRARARSETRALLGARTASSDVHRETA